ncbi:MAG: exodeoxyribonuclease VII small subunit [Erysipelotrichaceae bacterium]|nr:exodeoxyribonuclease VII small subunit [Erysipelotrichaceae bacterium]
MAKEKFEDRMNRLSEIVEKLDDENVDLDESIKLYEEGLKLSKELKEQLEGFKEKIDSINKGNEND